MPLLKGKSIDDQMDIVGLLSKQMIDVTGPYHVNVVIDRRRDVLYINVNGVCLFRACQVENWVVEEIK